MTRFNSYLALPLAFATGALWVGASPAQAGTLSEICHPCGKPTYVHVVYTALPGERNVVSVASQVDVGQRPAVHVTAFRDEAGIVPAPEIGCEPDPADPLRVICTWSQPTGLYFGLGFPILRLGDGDDSGSLPAGTLDGGAGADTLSAVFQGEFIGGPGDDRLLGGSQGDRFLVSAGMDGADAIKGGPGRDSVSYQSRSAPVRVDLNAHADDGAPGEKDRISTDVEVVAGGKGADELRGDRAENELYGEGGDDSLLGGAGPDLLFGDLGRDELGGGPGEDTVTGGPGRDRLLLRDGSIDQAGCGPGRDTVFVDRLDFFGTDCEHVRGRRIGTATFVSAGGSRALNVTGNRAGDIWTSPTIGCPGDSKHACTGAVSIAADSVVGGRKPFRIQPGLTESPRIALSRDFACPFAEREARAQLTLRTRDALDRPRTLSRRVTVLGLFRC